MPEGVQGYPRWDGELRTFPSFPVIVAQELRRAWYNQWSRAIGTVVVLYAVLYLTLMQANAFRGNTMDGFYDFVNLLRWGALGLAATMAGPALLEDKRRGALELYYSRGVRRSDYLAGKSLAILLATTAAVYVPALVYYGLSFFVFEEQPDAWNLVPASALAYALLWGLLVTGVGLGLACLARNSRAASLLLFGSFAIADIFIGKLLSGITRNEELQIISPFAALEQLGASLFSLDAPHAFPTWWGIVAWLALTLAGWALFAWKHPRMEGEERAGR